MFRRKAQPQVQSQPRPELDGKSRSVSGFTGAIQLVYVLAAACFVVGLHLMNSPATARRGNQVSMAGMVIAVIATLILMIHDGTVTATGWIVLISGALIGSAIGLYAARTVQMTAMPQLVSAFNAVGGGAAALIAIYGYIESESNAGGVLGTTTVFTLLDVLIGAVTFSGSIIAAGKLQGLIPGQPIIFKGGRALNVALAVGGHRRGRVHADHGQPARAAHRGAGLAGVRGDDGAADRRRGHAGGHLAAERVHRHRGGDGRVRHRELGADRGRRAGGRVGKHPDQADGGRDEPVAGQHHPGRVRHRGQRDRGGGGRGRAGPLDRRRRRGHPARLRVQGDHRAGLRPGRGAGPARRGRAGQDAWRTAASRSATPSTRWRAGCPVT